MTFATTAPAFTGTSCLAMLPRRAFRVLLLRLDRIRQLLVAHSPGTVRPLGFLLVGPRFPEPDQAETCSLSGPYGPVTDRSQAPPEAAPDESRTFLSWAVAYETYGVLSPISRDYPPLRDRSLTCYSAVRHYLPRRIEVDRSTCTH